MILTVKNADFSVNAIDKIIDYSDAKSFLLAHYPTHSDDLSAEALQVFWNTLGKGVAGSVYERLRWLLLPIFGNSTTEDLYDAKNGFQCTSENISSLTHLRRGVVFTEIGAPACIVDGLPYDDAELGSIFYVKESLGNQYVGSGGIGGFLRYSTAPLTLDTVSKTQGGTAISNMSVSDGKILIFYEFGNLKNSIIKYRSENDIQTYYLLSDLNQFKSEYNKKITRLCSHHLTNTSEYANTSNPVMMVGSVKNMTDEDGALLISAIKELRTTLNV